MRYCQRLLSYDMALQYERVECKRVQTSFVALFMMISFHRQMYTHSNIN